MSKQILILDPAPLDSFFAPERQADAFDRLEERPDGFVKALAVTASFSQEQTSP